jgi:hypothetical protein
MLLPIQGKESRRRKPDEFYAGKRTRDLKVFYFEWFVRILIVTMVAMAFKTFCRSFCLSP